MNESFFVMACAGGAVIDLLLLRALFQPLTPVLQRGRRRVRVTASPFVISSDAAAHLVVEAGLDASVAVLIYLDRDRRWRVQRRGAGPASLNGRLLRQEMRLFDENEIVVGNETFVFRDPLSAPTRPVFAGYRVHGHPYRGGSSLVYPASLADAHRSNLLLKVRDPSHGDEGKEVLNDRVRSEYRHLASAHEGASEAVRRRFPLPHALLQDPEGYHAIAMENVRGITLKEAIRRQTLRPLDVARFGAAFARALERLDTLGIVHCDLKPGNVVLRGGRCDDPCLVDFGIAVLVGARSLPGTPGFQSPEHEKLPMSPRSDVFVMGALLEACLSDRGRGEPIRHELEALIGEMRRDLPDDRPSAREVHERLERMIGGRT